MSDAPISAASRTAGRTIDPDPPLPPCLLVDLLWEQFAEQGADAFAAGRAAEAAALWRVAGRLAAAFAAADPRRAASLAGLGLAHRLDGDLGGAEALHRAALAAWSGVDAWLDRMRPGPRPRSTAQHFRLEKIFRAQHAALARAEHRRLADAGVAASLSNLASLLLERGRAAEAGEMDERASALRAAAPGPVPGGRERFRAERSAAPSDLRKLQAAVYLLPILRPAAPTGTG